VKHLFSEKERWGVSEGCSIDEPLADNSNKLAHTQINTFLQFDVWDCDLFTPFFSSTKNIDVLQHSEID
jgi:hypothetical protein